MKLFLINEQQLATVANTILEFPAKKVLNSLDILRNLPLHEENKSLEVSSEKESE